MDHNRALDSQAVERYLLGEMSTEERDSFEEHFFGCEECAQDVRDGARFRENAREVLPEFQQKRAEIASKPFWRWWRPPALALVTATLGMVVVYQAAVQVPSLKNQIRAQTVPAFALHATARGEESLPHVPANAGLFTLYFDLPGAAAPPYECTLTDASGKVVDTFPADPKPNETLNVLLDRARLSPGRYTLTLKSTSETGAVPNQFQFIVQ